MNATEAIQNPENLLAFMSQATDRQDWQRLCAQVKAAGEGRYPAFWFPTIVASGAMDRILGAGSSTIAVSADEPEPKEEESPFQPFKLKTAGEQRTRHHYTRLAFLFLSSEEKIGFLLTRMAQEWQECTDWGRSADYAQAVKDSGISVPYTEEQLASTPFCAVRDRDFFAVLMTEYMVHIELAPNELMGGQVAFLRDGSTEEERAEALGIIVRGLSKLHVAMPGGHGAWWELMCGILSADRRELLTGEKPTTCSQCDEVGYWEDFCPECGQTKGCPNWCIESNACDDCRQAPAHATFDNLHAQQKASDVGR